jgi:uncharacterized protein (DUF1684 family)
MMKTLFLVVLLLTGFQWIGCSSGTDQAYVDQINEWHQGRVERLTSENGWMSLAGLFWLNNGENTFGADSSNDVIFPSGKAPNFIGSFELKDGIVRAKILPNVEVVLDDKPVTDVVLDSDAGGNPTVLHYGTLSWYVIRRSNDLAIRLKDSANPVIKSFHGIERYPVESSWRLEAKFEAYNPQKSISVPTILGTIEEEPSAGALVFKIENKTYRLDAVGNLGDEQFFIIFGDETNKDETYESGRYVYVDNPGNGGKTILDFNKAYNPPCAFTQFATCPFPPPQNILPLKVTAGEKKYH